MRRSQPGSCGVFFSGTRSVIVQAYHLSTGGAAGESNDTGASGQGQPGTERRDRPLHDAATVALLPPPRHVRIRRTDRTRRIHAARPRRGQPLVLATGLPRVTCTLAAFAGAPRRAARQVSRVGPCWYPGSNAGGGGLHRAVVPDGA